MENSKKNLPDITHKMLSQQLKELEAEQLIHRKEYHQIPQKVEYWLTPKRKKFTTDPQLNVPVGGKFHYDVR